MSSNFLSIAYQGSYQGHSICLLEPASQSDFTNSYIILYVPALIADGYTDLGALIMQLRQTNFYKQATFAFTKTKAGATPQELKAFSETVMACALRNQAGNTSINVQLMWFEDVTAISQTPPPFIGLTLANRSGYYQLYVDTAHSFPVGDAGGADRYLSLDFETATNSFLYCVENKLALACLVNTDSTLLAFGQQGMPDASKASLAFLPIEQQIGNGFYSYFTINLDSSIGPVGLFDFTGLIQPGFEIFSTGLQYSVIDEKGKDKLRLAYPLFTDISELENKEINALLDPLSPFDHDRTRFRLKAGTQFTSTFRTMLGSPILLKPSTTEGALPAQFVFYPAAEHYIYLGPTGDFGASLSAAEVGTDYKNNLLCGLSSTEYLQVEFGSDEFRFVASQPVTVEVSQTNNRLQVSDLDKSNYLGSWLRVINPAGGARQYYSEPNGQSFYVSSSTDSALLSYYPLTQNTLQLAVSAEDSSSSYPIACYSALDFGNDAASRSFYEYFESQVLSPTRTSIIKRLSHSGPPPAKGGYPVIQRESSADGTLMTPLGYRAQVTNGNWTGLRFAQTSDNNLELNTSPEWASLPQAIQDAFLTNQQFTVVSVDSGSNLGTPSLELSLAGWDFKLYPPKAKDQKLGSYYNVLIFKSCAGSLQQWISTPGKWTNYGDFNDTDSDPKGNYLSSWLVDYCDTAIAAYKAGNHSFENFYELVTDEYWNGFIALNVAIDVGDLDSSLDPLLGGIDLDKFFAHHVGNEATRAQPVENSKDFELDSSLFALIYYNDPGYNAKTGKISTPQSSSDYDFRVMTLTALFLKSGIASFSSKLMLSIGSLFGSKVMARSPDPSFPASTSLLLDGSAQNRDGVFVYSFRTAKGSDSYFYLASGSLTAVEVTQAEFAISSVTGDATAEKGKDIESAFRFWGNLVLSQGVPLPAPNANQMFDIFSYERLAFSHLDLTMGFTLYETKHPGGKSTFEKSPLDFDLYLDAITLSNQQTEIVKEGNATFGTGSNYVREGSLLSQFPLKLKRFIVASKDSGPPSSLGYSNLNSRPISRANMNGTLKDEEWFALEFEMELGSMGALAPSVVFTADVLFGWSPASGDIYTGIKLPGLGPPDKLINIEGIITFGSKAIIFDRVEVVAYCNGNQTTKMAYVINFASIGLHLLSLSYPPAGSTNVSVFGNPCLGGDTLPCNVGWFGSYIQPGTKPIDPPPSMSQDH